MVKQFIGYAGTYTRETSEGIYRFTLDIEKKQLTTVDVAAQIGSPTYVTVSDDQQFLFAVAQKGDQGGVASYKIDQTTGALTFISEVLSDGAPPCHVSIRDGELLTSNYHKGTVELYKVDKNGTLDKLSEVQHVGHGPHERQEKPHVHYAAHTPDGQYVVAVDLGTDEVVTYQINDETLVPVHTLHVKPGSGPRHLAFHPDGQTAYLLNELSSEVMVLDYDQEHGVFNVKQTISALPENFSEVNDASAIYVSSDGKFLYTGNRGHDSIAVFKINENKQLHFVEHVSTGGAWPRDFVIDPTENFIVAANQHSGNLVLFLRDKETGQLTPLNSEVTVPETVCVQFLPIS